MALRSFHFDLGNSSEGPIGFCARVRAENEEEALALLKAALPGEHEVQVSGEDHPRVECIEVYFNDAAITVEDIDDAEDADEEDTEEEEEGDDND